jgi:hypothetical protein
MTTISEILDGAEQYVVARAAEVAMAGEKRLGKPRLTDADYRAAIRSEVAKILSMTIDTIVSDSLSSIGGPAGSAARLAWEDHRKLQDAARETQHDPALTKTVTLLEYHASLVYEGAVRIDLVLGYFRHRLATLTLSTRVTVQVADLTATVQRGLLTRVAGRAVQITVQFSVPDLAEVSRQSEFAFLAEIRLGTGIPLLPRARGGRLDRIPR